MSALRDAIDGLDLYSSLSVEECEKIESTVHKVLADALVPEISRLRNFAVADRPALNEVADTLEGLLS